MNGSYLSGSRIILHPWFDPEATLRAIAKHRVTQFAGVPTMYIMLLNTYNPKVHDTSSLRELVVSAAPMPVGLFDVVEQKLGGRLYEGYGLTEAAPSVSMQRRDGPNKRGSIGFPLPDVEVRIFDEQDQEVPRGTWGEIVVRGPNVMKGYWNKPKETAEALRNGWLHTGDIGYMDEDGELFITDRKKDLIIRGGENISPSEIEEVIFQHPAVLEASVIGVPDPKYGEEVKAIVVPKPGLELSEQEVIDFCLQRIARFRCPKTVAIAKTLPKNPVGKVLKRELRKQFGV
jgi:long-chain acyl-CoA synthetase